MMNFESDERNLPQKISEDIISFILNTSDEFQNKSQKKAKKLQETKKRYDVLTKIHQMIRR